MIDKKRESKFIASNHQPPEHERELSMSARALDLKEYFASRILSNHQVMRNFVKGSDESEHGI